MNLEEMRIELQKLEKHPPRTEIKIQHEGKGGVVRVAVSDIRFNGSEIVIVDAYPSG